MKFPVLMFNCIVSLTKISSERDVEPTSREILSHYGNEEGMEIHARTAITDLCSVIVGK
jgi:hypothetical protein